MKSKRAIVTSLSVVALLLNGFAASAQQEKSELKESRNIVVELSGSVNQDGPPPEFFSFQGDNFSFIRSEMSFGGKVVKGAPYSAQMVNESVQTLADGNRIVHRNESSVARDSEGRTRREQVLHAIGPWTASGEPQKSIFIQDPVAGVNYVLEPGAKTARKMTVVTVHSSDGPAPAEALRRHPGPPPEIAVSGGRGGPGGPGVFNMRVGGPNRHDAKEESLGKKIIAGVEAEGTRSTITIPAGEIGNEQPILIVSERWYSPQLQTVVMSKHSDPRMGETTFQLTNLSRDEPAHSLFEVPSDYTVKEESGPGVRMQMKKRTEL